MAEKGPRMDDFVERYRLGLRRSDLGSDTFPVRTPSETLPASFENVFCPLPLEVVHSEAQRTSERIGPESLFKDGRQLIWLESGKGSGKSTLLRWLLREALNEGQRVVFPLSAKRWQDWCGNPQTGRYEPPSWERWLAFAGWECLTRAFGDEIAAKGDQFKGAQASFDSLVLSEDLPKTFLVDGADEILDPEHRKDFWECWNAFRTRQLIKGTCDIRAVLSFRKEGRPRDHLGSRDALVTIPPLDEDTRPQLARHWADALTLDDAERFAAAVTHQQYFTTPMWVRTAALMWDRDEGLPDRPFQLYLWYARALLKREHDPDVPSRSEKEVKRELSMLGRVADRALGTEASLRIDCDAARDALKEDSTVFGWNDAEIDEQIQDWKLHGGLIDFHPPEIAWGKKPGRDESFSFQAQDFDFLLAFDAGDQLVRLLVAGPPPYLRWPAVIGTYYKEDSQDYLPDRVLEEIRKSSQADRDNLLNILTHDGLRAIHRLTVGHILEQALGLPGYDFWRKQEKARWRLQVRKLLSSVFPSRQLARQNILMDTPAPARVRAAESLARLGDPRQELLDPTPRQFLHIRAPETGRYRLQAADRPELNFFQQSTLDLEEPVGGFGMARFPVTVVQYQAFLDNLPAQGHKEALPYDWEAQTMIPTAPVVGVSFRQAESFCEWLTDRLTNNSEVGGGSLPDGCVIRLPTEYEWEWAAAGESGERRRKYPWGDEPPDAQRANFGMRIGRVSPVGCFPDGATPDGVEEMGGNVLEWTTSAYDRGEARDEDPPRVVRGGAFVSFPGFLASGVRYWIHPGVRLRVRYVGFRVVVSPCS